MTRAKTMLEMCELHDMLRLGEEMTPVPRSSSGRNEDDDNDDNGGCFYIDSSHSPALDVDREPDVATEAVVHPPEEAQKVCSKGVFETSLRRSKSAESLITPHRLRVIDLSHDMIHSKVDNEERTNEDPILHEEQGYNACVEQNGDESFIPLNDLVLSPQVSKTSQSQLTNSNHSIDVIPPRQSTSFGKPLRSNLKGSSNSLGCLVDSSQRDGSTKNPGIRRNVSFSSIEIRSYAITLGDAPTVSGPPISLDWEYYPTETKECTVDAYEGEVNNAGAFPHQDHDDDLPRSRQRRERHGLWISPIDRQYLLMREWGYSRREIEGAMKEARRASQRRARTARKSGLEPLEEALEKAMKKVASLGRSLKMRP
ncbi:hypothetical protein ACHAXA_010030 [Cyclostephanos tholiformis]|uniref:Uncharacterized protein n=1 Tax=Cyclostephanos tholiformis TaxID=382380 RepID=A0ABD3RGF2_9STRA